LSKDVIMIDMPTIMLRMKICESHTLEELVEIFNVIIEKI